MQTLFACYCDCVTISSFNRFTVTLRNKYISLKTIKYISVEILAQTEKPDIDKSNKYPWPAL